MTTPGATDGGGADPPDELTARAPAKVNLGLAVTGLRPDGYHELRTVFLRIGLADTVGVRLGRPGQPDRLVVDGDPGCPTDDNLVLRAGALLRAELGDRADGPMPGLAWRLQKRIPMAAGLGGGSSDAAAALDLAARAWRSQIGRDRRLALASRLGADVPFFVSGLTAALVEGFGERVTPLPPLRTPVGLLLVCPPVRVATPAVFRAWDEDPVGTGRASVAIDALVAAWERGLDGAGLAATGNALRDANDLWRAATVVAPGLVAIRDVMEERLGRPALLTGSGSTLVALYPSPADANDAADVIGDSRSGPLSGVRVVATASDTVPRIRGEGP